MQGASRAPFSFFDGHLIDVLGPRFMRQARVEKALSAFSGPMG